MINLSEFFESLKTLRLCNKMSYIVLTFLMCIQLGYSSTHYATTSLEAENATDPEFCNIEEDCDFIITSATCDLDGNFVLCVEAVTTPAGCLNIWEIWSRESTPVLLATGIGASTCITFADPGVFFRVDRYCGSTSGTPCSQKNIEDVDCNEPCDPLNFSYTVDADDCVATISYTFECLSRVQDIVVNWGDGSSNEIVPAPANNPLVLSHTYPTIGGNYAICITWADLGCPMMTDELTFNTCCYDVVIPDCQVICDKVSLTWQQCTIQEYEKCCIQLDVIHPYSTIRHEWLITEISTGVIVYNGQTIPPTLEHDFIGEGDYNICVTMVFADETSLTCCFIRKFPPCKCCMDADFEWTIDANYNSCQKNKYNIVHDCNDAGMTTHKWIFSDGTEYNGYIPPPHVFTDYVNTTGEVCVTHQIFCGGLLQDEVTKCDAIYRGNIISGPIVFLGEPGLTKKMTDVLDNVVGSPTVYQFLKDAEIASIPVLIEGDLEVDIDVEFGQGMEWNMGFLSEIFVDKKLFKLESTLIQDAKRRGFACCRWQGIKVTPGSNLDWYNAFIHDAETMLYLYDDGTTHRTFMDIRYCVFEANVAGILWEDHRGTLTNFYGNFFNNPDNCAGTVCGCCYTIAINLNGVSTGVVFPEKNGLAYNQIHGYQHGIKALNTSLFVRNFNIENLKESATVTGGSGIWFIKDTSTYRLLDLNEMHFTNMAYGVRMQIKGGGWQRLRAIAQNLSGHTTITMDDVYVGYDIQISGPTKLRNRSYITKNIINTNGGGANFGINIKIDNSESNTLQIIDNEINVSGGSVSTMGISLNAYVENSQNIRVVDNVINCASLKLGPGIYLNNWRNALIKNNTITVATFDGKYGIEVNEGSYNTIECNSVTNGEKGLQLFQSQNNTILGNTFNVQTNTVEVYNDCMGLGSYIARNTFNNSTERSNWYNTAAITGAQDHEEYNYWDNQNSGNYFEVYHKTPGLSPDCFFQAPSNVPRGDYYYPWSYSLDMLINNGADAITNDPCSSGGGGGGSSALMSPSESGNAYAGIIANTAAMDSMNLAPRTAFEQSVYMQIAANPNWQTTYPVLDSFYSNATSTYVGQSATVYLQIESLQAQVEGQAVAMYTDLDQLATLTTELDSIEVLMGQTTDTVTLAALEAEIDLLLPQIVVLEQNISVQLVVNEGINQTSIAAISSLISGLSAVQVWEVDEKRVFEILIDMIEGSSPSSADLVDLRAIAQKCYEDNGRAVFMAQALCLHLLDEYYALSDCGASGAMQAPSSSWSSQESWTLSIQPNPADDILYINIDGLDENVRPEVFMFDIMGRAVYPVVSALSNAKYSILTNDLLEGVYMIRVKNGESHKVIKVIIEH